MAKVDIISSCLVPMANNDNNISMSTMDLTPWDLQFLLLEPIQKGVLFHNPQSQQLQNTIVDHLKNTLSHTLSFFPPLAGRLSTVENDENTTSYFVDCNNAGAEFTHAVAADVCVADILESKYIPETVSSFFTLNGVSNFEGFSKPLLGVQVTELLDGLFISCTANHAVIDGTSFWHFFNSWSEISRGFEKISKTPLFEPWFPSNINGSTRIPLPPLEQNLLQKNHVLPPLLQRFFHLSKESVAKLKAKANSEASTDKIISSLQAVSAHLWRSVVRSSNRINRKTPQIISQEEEEEEVYSVILMIIGARARIPLGDGYFGNGAYIAKTSLSENELLEKGLGYAGMKISEFVGRHNREEVIKFVEDWIEKPTIVRKGSISVSSLAITSSPRHNVYGSDFGWGRPIAVRSGKSQKFNGKMTTFPAAEVGGIDVEVCLTPEIMQAMEDDAEFLEAFAI